MITILRIGTVVLGAILLAACASRQTRLTAEAFRPEISGMLRVFSARGIAQGCPIDETAFLTARHVGVDMSREGPPERVAVVWSDADGRSGSAWTEDYDWRRDLALMRSDRPFARVYRVAPEAPQIGERVVLVGYDFRGERPLAPRIVTARVLNVVSVHLVLSSAGAPGFSGSCVLNARSEAVGVFQGAVESETRRFGIASGIWGIWRDVSWVPPDPG